ncbi:MAG: DUF4351 domain-containing protein [Candidatus Obscuribacterales bacterium]|nr:DUF4351 domain-containing protein [Candidatus Obscuribacterales bacterium]
MANHDRRFKQLLSALFFEIIELFLPDLAQDIDRNSPMVLLDKEILTDLEAGESHEVDWRLFLKSDNKAAAALMAKMRFAPEERVHVKLECLKMLVRSKANKAELRLISQFIDNYLRLNAEEIERYRIELSKMNKSDQEDIMEVETSWKQEGLDIGRHEGRIEGRIEGRLEVLITQLNRRLGQLSPQMSERILKLRDFEIAGLTSAIFDFSSMQDLEDWLNRA